MNKVCVRAHCDVYGISGSFHYRVIHDISRRYPITSRMNVDIMKFVHYSAAGESIYCRFPGPLLLLGGKFFPLLFHQTSEFSLGIQISPVGR